MDIIVDSSVWIDFFNFYQSKESDELQKLIEHNGTNNIFICPTIYMEVLRGIKDDHTFYDIKEALLNFFIRVEGLMPRGSAAVIRVLNPNTNTF